MRRCQMRVETALGVLIGTGLGVGCLSPIANAQCASSWSTMGNPFSVSTEAFASSGTTRCDQILFAGGISSSGGNVLQWNDSGSSWDVVGGGVFGGVYALEHGDIGEDESLYVLGNFTEVGPMGATSAQRIARWDGNAWYALGEGISGSGIENPYLNALQIFDDGTNTRLFVGGRFQGFSTMDDIGVAYWNGTGWSDASSGLDPADTVFDFVVFDDGNGEALYASGTFIEFGDPIRYYSVAKWSGSAWTPFGEFSGGDEGRALTVWNDGNGEAIYIGGVFDDIESVSGTKGIARWDGTTWTGVGGGLSGSEPVVEALTVYSDESGSGLFLAGGFTVAGLSGQNIARWDGTAWSDLDDGIYDGLSAVGRSLIVFQADPAGSLQVIVGGAFSSPGSRIASWGGWTQYADFIHDGSFEFADVQAYLVAYSNDDLAADTNCDEMLDFYDLQEFLSLYSAGCP